MRRKMAAGNWKMHGLSADLAALDALCAAHPEPAVDILICPPAPLLSRAAARVAQRAVALGGQDCHAAAQGAHTGDVAAAMLADAGASHVILGHSERRADHGEDDATVHAKVEAAWNAGLIAVICLGETLDAREAGKTLDVIGAQLAGSVPDAATPANTVIAYEPVWAIGTGKVAGPDEIAEVHAFLRQRLAERFGAVAADGMRLLYGGSVKPGNAAEIFAVPEVDGALVGGASLKPADFSPIIAALEAST